MIKIYDTHHKVQEACCLGIIHSLHQYGGLYDSYVSCRDNKDCTDYNPKVRRVYLFFSENEPVASLLFLAWNKIDYGFSWNCEAFTKEKYRRRGIMSKLIEQAKLDGEIIEGWEGSYVAKKFYQSIKKAPVKEPLTDVVN